jgi:hypothetical protein
VKSGKLLSINPNPTLFRARKANEPYSRGQCDSALKATPHSPKGDVSYVGALERTVRSGAHGFRSRRPRSLLTVLNFCRIRLNHLKRNRPGKKPTRLSSQTREWRTWNDGVVE